jgi:membrane protease YdiL (CAAX protease family)
MPVPAKESDGVRMKRASVLFLALLLLFSTLAYVPIIRARSLAALWGYALVLIMWAPGGAALITSWVCYRSLRPCGFGIHRRTWFWLLIAVAVPIIYTLAIHLPLQALGIVRLGGPALTVGFLVVGFFQSLFYSTGEELGWRGFFAPLLMKQLGFLRGNALVGVCWALYHAPAILLAGYGRFAYPLLGLLLFTCTVMALSLFLGFLRLASGSLWPAAVFHCTHNLIFLHLFDPMVKVSPAAAWLAGEEGALLCAAMIGLAGIALFLMRRSGGSSQP